jgi:NAD(P)-dependent dehydrogenase (short-subunit alcohol dehydrogenase family)
MSKWTTSNIPDLTGKVIIITGSSSGIGKAGTEILAKKNATIVMAVRNAVKGESVANEIKSKFSKAKIEVLRLDLSSLKSVKNFADAFVKKHNRLDVLINNAGVMMSPFEKTEDGFELQMGTNHLGHFALTNHLLSLLRKTQNSRIVVTSSIAHRGANIDLSDLNWESRKYNTQRAYCDSKIASLLFMNEFANRFNGNSDFPKITAAHPGWTSTELQRHSGTNRFLNIFFGQKPDMGILPTLRAGFDNLAKSGDYYGPRGIMELQGYPVKVKPNKGSQNMNTAKQLWDISEKLTGVVY